MPSREDVAYFGAGPAPLPTSVLEEASRALLNYKDTGLSICEISHRSTLAAELLEDTKAAFRSLLDVPDTHEILFMQGGASAQFSAVPLNLIAYWVETRRRTAATELNNDEAAVLDRVRQEIKEHLRIDYLVTGGWSLKASQEAALLFEPLTKKIVNVAADSRKTSDGKFRTIPSENTWKLTPVAESGKKASFVYYCDNETVDGVEFSAFPPALDDGQLVVADMSSNILSRPVDVSQYGVVFFGAQKNISSAGLTIAVIRKDILTTVPSPSFLHALGIWSLPTVLSWPTVAKSNSLYNTLELLPVYIALLVTQDLLSKHGKDKLIGQAAVVDAKAQKVYGVLEKYPDVYQVVPDKSARSRMNICFRVKGGDEGAEKAFIKAAEERLLQGLKGHRSVGGIRVSNYNSVTLPQVERLVAFMEEFAKGA